jgi:hypothetical protein
MRQPGDGGLEHGVVSTMIPCGEVRSYHSEEGVKLAQKLGQLQTFTAVFRKECMGQLAPFGLT